MSSPSQRDTKTELEDILFACLEAEDASAALERACEAHPLRASQLRKAYESLRQHELVGDSGMESIPERLGRYRLVERLGEGGMGVVYLADDEELGRRVAVKLIRPEHLFFENARERFRREVEAAARLQHPGIAAVYDFGEERGLPYFSMEYIAGESVADVLQRLLGRDASTLRASDLGFDPGAVSAREQTWPVAVAKLTRAIALALAHAHARGVVHRDIKPSNVLLDEDGQARLVDFGLAGLEDATALTRSRAEVGSLPYMPPEIVAGKADAASPEQDVYSLGVSLYEMLTTVSPFLARTAQKTRSRILDHEFSPLRTMSSQVPRDLETICAKMMDPVPERRYGSAVEVADELTRFVEQRPIQARRAGAVLRAWRWSQRRPALAASVVLGFSLFCVVPIAFAIYQSNVAEESSRLESIARENSYIANVSAAQQYMDRGEVGAARRHLETCPEELRAWEWRYLWGRLEESVTVLRGHDGPIQGVALVGENRQVVSGSRDGTVRRWFEDGTHEVLARDQGWVLTIAAFRGGAVWSGKNGKLWRWTEGAEPALLLDLGTGIESLAVDPDERFIALGSSSGGVALWDAGTEAVVELRRGSESRLAVPCFSVCFDDDGRLFATVGRNALCWDRPRAPSTPRRIGGWDAVPGGTPAIGHASWLYELAVHDGVLWTFDETSVFCTWDVRTGQPLQLPVALRYGSLNAAAFNSDGTLFVGSSRPMLRIEEGRVSARYLGHTDDVLDLAIDPGASRVVSVSRDAEIRVWSCDPPQRVLDHSKSVNVIHPLRKPGHIITACSDRVVRVWDVASGDVVREHDVGVRARKLVVSKDETAAAAVGEGRVVHVDLTRQDVAPRSFTRGLDVAWLGSATTIAVLYAKSIEVWEIGATEPSQAVTLEDGSPALRTLVTRGDRLVVGSADGKVHEWSTKPLQRGGLLCEHTKMVSALQFTPDGTTVMSASFDGHVKFTRIADGESARPDLVWEGATLQCLAMHPDGTRVALGAINNSLASVWQLDRAEPLLLLAGHERAVLSLAFSPDGRDLMTASWDGTVRVWAAGGD